MSNDPPSYPPAGPPPGGYGGQPPGGYQPPPGGYQPPPGGYQQQPPQGGGYPAAARRVAISKGPTSSPPTGRRTAHRPASGRLRSGRPRSGTSAGGSGWSVALAIIIIAVVVLANVFGNKFAAPGQDQVDASRTPGTPCRTCHCPNSINTDAGPHLQLHRHRRRQDRDAARRLRHRPALRRQRAVAPRVGWGRRSARPHPTRRCPGDRPRLRRRRRPAPLRPDRRSRTSPPVAPARWRRRASTASSRSRARTTSSSRWSRPAPAAAARPRPDDQRRDGVPAQPDAHGQCRLRPAADVAGTLPARARHADPPAHRAPLLQHVVASGRPDAGDRARHQGDLRLLGGQGAAGLPRRVLHPHAHDAHVQPGAASVRAAEDPRRRARVRRCAR